MDVHIQLYPNPVESKCKIQLDLGFFPNPIPGVHTAIPYATTVAT